MQNPCASQSELIKDLSDSLEPYCGTEEIALEFEQHFKAAEGPRQSNSSEQHDSKQYVRKYCSKDNNFPCLFKPFGDDIVANSDAHDIEEKEEIVDILKLVNWPWAMQNMIGKYFIILNGLILEPNIGVEDTHHVAIRVGENDIVVAREVEADNDECQAKPFQALIDAWENEGNALLMHLAQGGLQVEHRQAE